MRLLLAKDGVDADSKDGDGRTPVSYAAENGQEAVGAAVTRDGRRRPGFQG